jgi:catechol 2,3-dioxygenase-like lactoylglutathione lyase family enzyme
MLKGLNHITLAVSDLGASFQFYTLLLGFKPEVKWSKGAYLSLGSLWLCLSLDEPKPALDYTHIALDIDQENFAAFSETLINAGVTQWKENNSEGDSLYFLDPDGHKLEVHVGSLQSRLESLKLKPYAGATLY